MLVGILFNACQDSVTDTNDGSLSKPKPTYSTPTIECTGIATETSISVKVTAGASGAPAGFSVQWMTADDYAIYGWSSLSPSYCAASFSGNASGYYYNLGANVFAIATIGDLEDIPGASTSCLINLECGTEYVFRAFAHGDNNGFRSAFSDNTTCSTVACEEGCTYTQGYWKTHGPEGCVTGNNTNMWPVTSLYLGNVSYTDLELCSILWKSPSGNGLVSLAHQLIAAKLNVANGVQPAQVTLNAIAAADQLIGDLVVPPVGAGTLSNNTTSDLTIALDNFNNGGVGPAHCGDE